MPLSADLVRRPAGIGGAVPVNGMTTGEYLTVRFGRRRPRRLGLESSIAGWPIDSKVRQAQDDLSRRDYSGVLVDSRLLAECRTGQR